MKKSNHNYSHINPHTGCGNFKAKKSMGQNFLKSKEALTKMCEAGGVTQKDIIIEIGPGKGALTEKLLEKAKKVIAVEKDNDLIAILTEKFTNELKSGKLLILNEDILFFDPKEHGLNEGGYKIIANIPYNITGLIIRRFLSEVNRPNLMTLLVQYEVAKRICVEKPHTRCGNFGKESILSLSVRAYGTPKYIMKVHKRFFSPSPKVDSAIISINNISNKFFLNKENEKSFFKLIKTGFAHKRKILRKNLEDLDAEKKITEVEFVSKRNTLSKEKLTQNKIDEVFNKLDIDAKVRAEDVPFEKWIEINKNL
jgi:16S rRNA (adenine1518-N6/adenine1519-N6)-dimethyltransferase